MAELREGSQRATVERITLTGSDGATIDAAHAAPDGGATTGIVLHPDILGLRAVFDDLSRRLATHGFAVCTPEPLARAPDDIRLGENIEGRMGFVSSLTDDLQLDDLARAAALLAKRDGVEECFVLGFCIGGMQVLKAAATGVFARGVAFYGMVKVPEMWQGGGIREPLATAKEVCPTLAIFGEVDHFVPLDDVEDLRAAWKDRPDCEIVVYPGAEHGFVHVPERDAHRPDDAADAWDRTLEFLSRSD
jgi:carboxymethylenebutenolidase